MNLHPTNTSHDEVASPRQANGHDDSPSPLDVGSRASAPSPIDPQRLYLPFSAGDLVIIGVSGGADSVTLLHLLRHAPMPLQLVVCHLNHQLRGDESDEDALFVEQLAHQWDLPFVQKALPIETLAKQEKQSLELCARIERYRFFEEVAARYADLQHAPSLPLNGLALTSDHEQPSVGEHRMIGTANVYIATGHTRSDEVETVLFRLARGTGLAGLCGIPQVRGRIVRPLLALSRSDIEAYCSYHNLLYREDASNRSLSFARNRIRHTVLPALAQVHPQAEQSIAHTAEILRLEQDFLQQYATEQYLLLCSPSGLDATGFRRLHEAVQYRVLSQFLSDHGISLERNALQSAIQIARQNGRMTLSPTLEFLGDDTLLTLRKRTHPQEMHPSSPKFLPSEGLFRNFLVEVYEIFEFFGPFSVSFDKNSFSFFDLFLDCGKIQGRIILRTRHPGDRINLPRYHCTKTFKKLFQEHQISPLLRSRLFVLQDERGVIALERFGVSQRVACDENTSHYLRIRRYRWAEPTSPASHVCDPTDASHPTDGS